MATFHTPSLETATAFHIGDFAVSNTLLTTWILMAVIIGFALVARAGLRPAGVPGRLQAALELYVDGLRSFATGIAGGNSRARFLMPVAASLFVLLLVSNWFGILPLLSSFYVLDGGHAALLRPPSTSLNFTFAMSIVAMGTVFAAGFRFLGAGFLGKYFTFRGHTITERIVNCFVGIMELVSEAARFLTFSFRLFGNIFAGKALLGVIGALTLYTVTLPFYGLELFVGFLQAAVFTVLLIVFTGIASSDHH